MNLDGTKLGGSDTTFIRLRIPVSFATVANFGSQAP